MVKSQSWSSGEAHNVMKRCIGAAVLGLPIWRARSMVKNEPFSLVSEYCHYEGAMARVYGLPILAAIESNTAERVLFNHYAGDTAKVIPVDADPAWAAQDDFRAFLGTWHSQLSERKDIFLAYSGKLVGTAASIHNILTSLGATVLDWKRDFVGARTILEQVDDAARRTSGGVFLFTRDDRIKGGVAQAAPRDNVIFEAGFFANAKGHERTLIIREEGVKMPADLGGVIYESLPDRADVSSLEERLRLFLNVAI